MPSIDEVIISAGPGEMRLALMAKGRPIEFVIDRGGAAAGDIVLGRVLTVNRALDAAFVDIGEAEPGFLAQPKRLGEGDAVVVQIAGAARGDKGAVLTAVPSLVGRLLAYVPGRPGLTLSRRIQNDGSRDRLTGVLEGAIASGEGAVLRTAAAAAPDDALLAELDALRRQWQSIAARAGKAVAPAKLHAPPILARLLAEHPTVRRLRIDDPAALAEVRQHFPAAELQPNVFEDEAGEVFDLALARRVALSGGGALIIEAAAGLTVIDVDSGGGGPLEANLAAVPEIVRQLRLRGVAGHVVIDIIPLRDRRALGRLTDTLRRAVADDPTPTHVIGTTPLGMIEMTRERRRPTLAESMLAKQEEPRWSDEAIGLAALRAVLRAALDRPGTAMAVATAPPVIAALRRRPSVLAETACRLGRPLTLLEDKGAAFYDLVEDKG
jgi:Rne/Rng family ribonuclease